VKFCFSFTQSSSFLNRREKSKGSGLFYGPRIGADFQIIVIELLIEPNASFEIAGKLVGKET